jgi:ArsR family transcriptional regulator, arsenate/arsenite/antimonite-responsive transcriptional repressor
MQQPDLGSTVSVPPYQAKAELFRTLGHPIRIRVLELLQDGPKAVSELLVELDIEPSSLSQQLAVLRRAGIVVSSRKGTGVVYEVAASEVAGLMRAARRFLAEVLAGQGELLAELRSTDAPSAVKGRTRRRV